MANPPPCPPQVCVSIVHWNGGDSTIDCVASVMAQSYPRLSVVMVDNGSTDDALDIISARWPGITILRNETNTGFTGGHNRGIGHAIEHGADYVLLLNQDATLLPDCVRDMVALCEQDEHTGLVSPVVYFKQHPSEPQFSGSWLQRDTMQLYHSHDHEKFQRQAEAAPDTICLWGTVLLVKCEVFRQVGLLDPRFFAYYEDSDLCVRASRRGWNSRMCFSAGALHEGHRTLQTRPPHFFYFMARNEMLFWKKVLGMRGLIRAIRVSAARALAEAGNMRDSGKHAESMACVAGMWDGLCRRHGPFHAGHAAPRCVQRVALGHPFLLAALLEGRFGHIMASFTQRLRRPS